MCMFNVIRKENVALSACGTDSDSVYSRFPGLVEQTPRLRNKVCVIRNPLTAGFSGTGREVLATPRQRVLLYIGRIHPEKGVHLLIEAFHCLAVRKMLRDWRLVIVGPWQTNMGGGGPSYRDALSRLALRLGERCTLVGPVFEQAGLMEFYRSASLFVYPTLAEKGEALPIAPLEALAMGCPALVSSLECFTDYSSETVKLVLFLTTDLQIPPKLSPVRLLKL